MTEPQPVPSSSSTCALTASASATDASRAERGHRRQVGEGEAGSQDRCRPQRSQAFVGQETDPAQDGQPQRWRQRCIRHLGRPSAVLIAPSGPARPATGHEQRVAPAPEIPASGPRRARPQRPRSPDRSRHRWRGRAIRWAPAEPARKPAGPVSGPRGRPQAPTRATGRYARRRTSAPVSRLDGSAHCRSSAPITSGPDSAASSARSANASTARNRSPGSLVTVIGPRSPPPRPPAGSAIATRRASGDEGAHRTRWPPGRTAASAPGSTAQPAATCMPRPRALASASSSSRVLPIPGSPSISTTADWPDAARSGPRQDRDLRRTPAYAGAGATVPTHRMLLPITGFTAARRPVAARSLTARRAGASRPGHLIQRPYQPEPAGEPDLPGHQGAVVVPGTGHNPEAATRRLDLVQDYADLHPPHRASPKPRQHRPAGGCLSCRWRRTLRTCHALMASGRNTQMPDLVILPAHDPTAAARLPGS